MKLRPSLAQLKTFPCQTQFDFNIISKFRCSLILCSLFLFQNFAVPFSYSLFPVPYFKISLFPVPYSLFPIPFRLK